MPYIKPGKLYEVQSYVAELAKQQSQSLDNCPEPVQEFLRTNPVNGEKQDHIRIVNVNGVWVDLDDAMDANELDHAFRRQGLPEIEEYE